MPLRPGICAETYSRAILFEPVRVGQRADRESRLRELVKGLVKTAGLTAEDFT